MNVFDIDENDLEDELEDGQTGDELLININNKTSSK